MRCCSCQSQHFNQYDMIHVLSVFAAACAGLTRLSYDAVGVGTAVLQLPAPAVLLNQSHMCSQSVSICCCMCRPHAAEL
jgi:hypothetical protein